MKPYVKPILRDLGRMDAVTRKSGDYWDPGGEPGGGGQQYPFWCQWVPWLEICGGSGVPPSGAQGTGSF